jgi:hypothetical protein
MRLTSHIPTAVPAAIGLAVAAVAFAGAGASKAATQTGYGVDIQAIYSRAGNPSLVANFYPDGALAKPRWSICMPPDINVCSPARSAGQFLQPGPMPAGTVFEAAAAYSGHLYIARTARWKGSVRAVVAPRLHGRPRSGDAVTPRGAVWTGGWASVRNYKPKDALDSGGRGRNFDFLSVEACRTRTGRHCVNLSRPKGDGFSRRPVTVRRRFVGWYLFAFDQRLAADTIFSSPAYGLPAAVPPLRTGPTVARSAPLGPVLR